ncbi:uncharacterized protein LOC130677093 [Microplitis mediator]|uniref:uncharacterized protein LOC130677093 n=1 Tax=Microplitis mediator TaxID=375433 RepID=UPI002555C27C|nr:uncharacterized protein LOC130677093 [Microplitis mediator]
MQGLKLFKKFLLPGGLCGAVPVIRPEPISPDAPVHCSNNNINNNANDGHTPRLIRPSELPIYVHHQHKTEIKTETRDDNSIRRQLEDGFGTVRKTLSSVTSEYQAIHDRISHIYNTGLAHSKGTIDYLHQEENLLPRIGTIFGGALTGLLLGIRGGKFKRIFYSTTGAGVMGAICYPDKAKDSLTSSKHYINIGYNFVYGVKPGDENQKEIKWPELPSIKLPDNFSDFLVLIKDTGSSVVTSIGSFSSDILKNENKSTEVKKETKDK